ncbi:glycoside hydrolase family 2 protein [Acidicapsa ligni]|uniref:glycoside hydrolase family 2 protein n=1 Tax=Acidicapsa ligni TaxID=542300 RepID=UPI0021DF980C|nr:glycosyl hydrolase family 2 [Acidicapsa ligni]
MAFQVLKRLLVVLNVLLFASPLLAAGTTMPLHEGWRLKSGCEVSVDGAAISKPGLDVQSWLGITVPSTVLAAQSAAKVVPDLYVGTHLRDIPGGGYPIGANFSNLAMPTDSPYRCAWWYRKEFSLPEAGRGGHYTLHFGGINYRANIWLNGKRIADSTTIAGAYRVYDLDVTGQVLAGQQNVLAVETFAPTEKDLGINWVDWSPAPPDKDMGLIGDVSLVRTGAVTLQSPEVSTHFSDGSLADAELTVYAELHNATDETITGDVKGKIAGVDIEQKVSLNPHEDRTVAFLPSDYPQLKIRNPKVWWPYAMGDPHLESLDLHFIRNGQISDEKAIRFGIREMTSELTEKGSRLFRVNGKPILIRGGGWSQDMLLRTDEKRLKEQFKLVRDLRLNTIRLEGKLETEDFFNLADEQGILVMLGWCCCDQWEQWDQWSPENRTVAAASLRSQMLRLRHHASLLVWLNGSDNPPPSDVEELYLKVEAETHWPNPTLSSASATPTSVSGKSGVKMTGPYDYVAPSYWYVDQSHGGAYGFNTETGPGPAIPSIVSLKKFVPGTLAWPPSEEWNFHNGGGEFHSLKVFDDAMSHVYTSPTDAKDYVQVAQTMQYDSERAMFEAYSRNKYTSTGVVQWMLNNAWPSNIWHLYDYYLDAGGGYFGVKKACEPVHIQYSYDDHSIVVVNSTYQALPKLRSTVHVYDMQLKEIFSDTKEVESSADSSTRAGVIPDNVFAGDSRILFVELMLVDLRGQTVSRNFYWVPTTLTTFDWEKTDFTHTPALKHEELSALRALKPVKIASHAETVNTSKGREVRVHLQNPSDGLAFQLSAAIRSSKGELVAPVLWSDNWIELMPGESATLIAILPEDAPEKPVVDIAGWNVKQEELSPTVAP